MSQDPENGIPILFITILKLQSQNCCVLYNTHCTQNGITQLSKLLTLLEFQARIADSLLHQKKCQPVFGGRPKSGGPVMIKRRPLANNAEAATVGHFPVFDKKQHRCKKWKTGCGHIP